MDEKKKEAVLGLLYGIAAGDKNKGPTFMSLSLLRSLRRKDWKYKASTVLSEYMKWYYGKGPGWYDTGPTSASIFREVKKIHPIMKDETYSEDVGTAVEAARKAAQNNGGGGINAAHRAMPIALIPLFRSETTEQDLMAIAKEESSITHQSPHSTQVVSALILLLQKILNGSSFKEALEMVKAAELYPVEVNRGSNGGFCKDAMSAALYFLSKGSDFDETLVESLRFAGPANYCPVLVGGIAGAVYGKKAICDSHFTHWTRDEFATIESDIAKVFM